MTDSNTPSIGQEAEKKEPSRQAEKLEAASRLAAGIAHDFNNILAAIMMQAELSTKAENMPAEAQLGFQKIRSAAERGVYLTRELLLFSNKQVIQPRNLNLNEAVADLTQSVKQIAGENIWLELKLHPAPLIAQADATLLDQMLLNLAANARDAMPQGGNLTVETGEKSVDERFAALHPHARPGHYVWFSVKDGGAGIPRDVLPKIFEPLFSTKEPGKSMGLGLATVLSVVKQHHGFLDVESAPDRGTKFTIYLPAGRADQIGHEPVAVTTKPASPKGTETILLVEDDEPMRDLAQSALEQNGYTVLGAGNGLEALKLWVRHRSSISLLLTDLAMPGGTWAMNWVCTCGRNIRN